MGRDNVSEVRTGGLAVALGSVKSWEKGRSIRSQFRAAGMSAGALKDSPFVCG